MGISYSLTEKSESRHSVENSSTVFRDNFRRKLHWRYFRCGCIWCGPACLSHIWWFYVYKKLFLRYTAGPFCDGRRANSTCRSGVSPINEIKYSYAVSDVIFADGDTWIFSAVTKSEPSGRCSTGEGRHSLWQCSDFRSSRNIFVVDSGFFGKHNSSWTLRQDPSRPDRRYVMI